MAGIVLTVLPVIIFFTLVQRHISGGLMMGGVNK
jgi:ABC-type glycerol-3-phosphate transport system permease component